MSATGRAGMLGRNLRVAGGLSRRDGVNARDRHRSFTNGVALKGDVFRGDVFCGPPFGGCS